MSHLLEEGSHFITHFEGTFFVTLKTILAHPGRLSLDYCNGIRKKYFKPLSLFLLLLVVYLIFPSFKGLNMDLSAHIDNRFYGNYAYGVINNLMSHKSWTMEETAARFHAASDKVSKFLLLIIIPFMSLLYWAILRRKRKMYFDHFIFATETASFFLLWGFLILPLIFWLLILIATPLGGGFLFNGEGLIGVMLLIPFLLYVWKATMNFYQLSRLRSLLYSVVYATVFTLFILIIYKFLQFIITVQLVH
jgi:hypothetical protein